MEIQIQDIIKNIRKNFIKDSLHILLRLAIRLVFLTLFAGLTIKGIIDDGIKSDMLYSIVGIIVSIVLLIAVVINLWALIENVMYAENPQKYKLFTDFPNIEAVFKEISENNLYNDDWISISNRYLLDKKDYRQLVKINEILAAYIQYEKVRGTAHRDTYFLRIYDIYGDELVIRYGLYGDSQSKAMAENALRIIKMLNSNAKIGYSNDIFDYVSKNKVERD
ncbi:MAG: hypothetical protein ACI4IG_02875 [Eubacterium sp.]